MPPKRHHRGNTFLPSASTNELSVEFVVIDVLIDPDRTFASAAAVVAAVISSIAANDLDTDGRDSDSTTIPPGLLHANPRPPFAADGVARYPWKLSGGDDDVVVAVGVKLLLLKDVIEALAALLNVGTREADMRLREHGRPMMRLLVLLLLYPLR